MQDEVTKHTKKIYDTVKNPKHTFGEKVKEVFVEIFIIVFAVTLSIWLHGWSEHRHQQKEVDKFLNNIKDDLKKDIETLTSEREEYIKSNKAYGYILSLNKFQFDSLAKLNISIDFPVHTHGQMINSGNYEGFKSSGKIGYIENEKLQQKILAYYQKTVPNIIEIDKIYSELLLKAVERKIENEGKLQSEIYTDPKFRSSISYILLLGKNNVRVYDEIGKKDAKDIISEIDNGEK